MDRAFLQWQIPLIVVVTLLVGYPSLYYPYGADQAIFGVIGNVWVEGGLPYRDAFDLKPPLIYGIYGIAQLMAAGEPYGIRVFDLIFVVITSIALSVSLQSRGKFTSTVSGALYPVVYYLSFNYWNSAQPESLINMLVAVSIAAISSQRGELTSKGFRLAIAAFLIGVAVQFKPFSLIFLLSLIPAASQLNGQRRLRIDQAAILIGVSLLPSLLVAAYFTLRGGLPFLMESIAVQAEYGQDKLDYIGGNFAERFSMELSEQHLLILVIVCAIPALFMRTGKGDVQPIRIWLLLSLGLILLQSRFYLYHFVLAAAPAAALFAVSASRLKSWFADQRSVVRVAGLITAIALSTHAVLFSAKEVFLTYNYMAGNMTQDKYEVLIRSPGWFRPNWTRESADWIKANTEDGDLIFVRAFDPGIYLMADRNAPTRHYSFSMLDPTHGPGLQRVLNWEREIDAALDSNPPAAYVLLVTWPIYDEDLYRRYTFEIGGQRYELGTIIGHYAIYITVNLPNPELQLQPRPEVVLQPHDDRL